MKNIDKETNRQGRQGRKGKKEERDIEFSRSYLGLLYMPKKIRELKSLLLQAGFSYKPAKGSHSKWIECSNK